MKKVISLFLICGLGILLITGCGCDKKDKNKNGIVDEDVNTEIKDQIVEGLDIIDFVVLLENNVSDVYFEIVNNTDDIKTFDTIECILYDSDGGIIYSFSKELGTLEPLEKKEMTYKVDIDLTGATNIEYVLK